MNNVSKATLNDSLNGQPLKPACVGSTSSAGSWYCLTHEQLFANQLVKDVHIDDDRSHVLAWICTLSIVGPKRLEVEVNFTPRNLQPMKIPSLFKNTEAPETSETPATPATQQEAK